MDSHIQPTHVPTPHNNGKTAQLFGIPCPTPPPKLACQSVRHHANTDRRTNTLRHATTWTS
eukprot:6150626-Prorocentrum_lima.AAC.1